MTSSTCLLGRPMTLAQAIAKHSRKFPGSVANQQFIDGFSMAIIDLSQG